VHLDVREYSAYWVDYAGPGEAPRGKHRETHDADDVHEEEPADVPDSTDGAPGALPSQPDAEVAAPKSPDAHAELARGSRPAQ